MAHTRAPTYRYLPAVTAVFVTCLIVANIIAVKPVAVGRFVVPAAVLIFPVSYIVGDVLTEVYGYAHARRVIWIGFACNLLAVIAIALGGVLAPAPFWSANDAAYRAVLGATPRLLAASFLAYLAGEFVNAFVLASMKVRTRGRWLWSRTIASTFLGQLVDSGLFIAAAFTGVWPLAQIGPAIATQWLLKCGYEILATPATYAVVGFLKRAENQDHYDDDTGFNPFAVGAAH